MFDLFDLEKLFNSWLLYKGSRYQCEVVPTIEDVVKTKRIKIDVYLVDGIKNKSLVYQVSSSGTDLEKMWDDSRSKLFAYFMEVGKNVE